MGCVAAGIDLCRGHRLAHDRRSRRVPAVGRAKRQGHAVPADRLWLVRRGRSMGNRRPHLPRSLHRLRAEARGSDDPGQMARRMGGDPRTATPAGTSSHQPGIVEVVAVLGARQGKQVQERRFLVPTAEFQARGPFGFVIDETRHAPYDGPSSFVGWQPRKAS